MALVECKDCKKQFSTDAKHCPSCGAKKPISTPKKYVRNIVITLFILPIFISLISGGGSSDSVQNISSTAKPIAPINWPTKPILPSLKNGVIIKAQFSDQNDNKPMIIGFTNLPDGTELMIDLDRRKAKYSGGTKTTVNQGRFQTERFTGEGGDLPPGNYILSISTPLPELEPESVKQIIGKHGENLKGKWTTISYKDKMVKYSDRLQLGIGESKAADAALLQRQKQAKENELREKEAKIPDARLMCKEFVKRTLNDPDSAQFDNTESYYAKYSKGIYDVQVSVRARNSFNALIYGIFDCKTIPASGDKWIPLGIHQIRP